MPLYAPPSRSRVARISGDQPFEMPRDTVKLLNRAPSDAALLDMGYALLSTGTSVIRAGSQSTTTQGERVRVINSVVTQSGTLQIESSFIDSGVQGLLQERSTIPVQPAQTFVSLGGRRGGTGFIRGSISLPAGAGDPYGDPFQILQPAPYFNPEQPIASDPGGGAYDPNTGNVSTGGGGSTPVYDPTVEQQALDYYNYILQILQDFANTTFEEPLG